MGFELCLAQKGERAKSLPGDELVLEPKETITHAITINAASEAVWPWLVQLGAGRAGWYSHDRIDNSGKPSAQEIIPGLQHVSIGDVMPAVPGSKDAFIVRDLLPMRALVLVVPFETADEEPDPAQRMLGRLRAGWALILEPAGLERTRLIARAAFSRDWLSPSETVTPHEPAFIERVYSVLAKLPWRVLLPVVGAGHYLMESRMLRGLTTRAEAQVGARQPEASSRE
jgi:hypothetical protein